MSEHKIGMGEIMPLLRISLCGTMQGPPIYEVMEMLGQEKVSVRLAKAFAHFQTV